MSANETMLEMARRHVVEGEARVQRQRALAARLRAEGSATLDADRLLHELETAQAQFEADLDYRETQASSGVGRRRP